MKQVLLLGAFLTVAFGEPIVESPLGRITGNSQTVLDVEIESFLGIPYAKPPVGDLRFALPEAFGVVGDLKATDYSIACPQPSYDPNNHTNPWKGGEDCLYLNVFRKHGTVKSDMKAVIAIVHGGGYVLGSASDATMNPASLAALGDVIVVSFNYRLGVFGFADMKQFAPANLGFHDQRLALQWIRDHIDVFGGNPDQVTAMGISAGSMSLSAQIITPIDDKNLFQSAVLDGGVVAGFDEDSESSFTRVTKIAEKLGCPIGSSEMVKCLRQAKVEDLLPLSFTTTGNNGMEFFVATTDGVFVPHEVEKYVEQNSAKLRKVRTIIGYAKDEGTFFTGRSLMDRDFPNPQTRDEIMEHMKIVSSSYNHPLDYADEKTRSSIAEHYLEKYPGDSFRAVAELQSDAVFKCPVHNFVRSYSRHNDEIYVYQFHRKLRRLPAFAMSLGELGAFHGSPYLHFTGSMLLGSDPVDPEDEMYSIDAIRTITDFAKMPGAPTFRETRWPSFSEAEEILIFDDVASLKEGFNDERTCGELFAAPSRSFKKDSKSEL